MVLKNRVLRNIFGPKRDEVKKGWRIFTMIRFRWGHTVAVRYKLEGRGFDSRWCQIKNEMGGTCSMCWVEGGSNRVLVCQCEGKIPLGRPRHRWNNQFKLIFK
jgi:hypothetical protein